MYLVSEVLGSGVTLGVPIALLTGYMFRWACWLDRFGADHLEHIRLPHIDVSFFLAARYSSIFSPLIFSIFPLPSNISSITASDLRVRNKVMILVMAVTALVGAAAAWRWGRALIGCTQQAREIRGNEVMMIYFL